MHGIGSLASVWDTVPNCCLLIQFMFNLKGIVKRSSACVDRIVVDVVAATCTVVYKNGSVYDYTNVSRRALFSLLNNESVSLGFFVNTHLLYINSKSAQFGACTQLV